MLLGASCQPQNFQGPQSQKEKRGPSFLWILYSAPRPHFAISSCLFALLCSDKDRPIVNAHAHAIIDHSKNMSSQFASMVPSLWKRATEGVTGALEIDALQYCILAAGTAIAWAYTIELDLLILYTFRRRKGLYFWSLLISSWGCTLHALGFILKFLVGATWLAVLPFIEVGE